MTFLKFISAILLLAMGTTSSPSPPCGLGVRGRHYGANIQPQVNPSTLQNRDPPPIQALKNAGFYIPSGAMSRGSGPWKPDGRQVESSSEEVHQNGDDYFDHDFKNEETLTTRDDSLLQKNSSHPNIAPPPFRQNSSSGLHCRGRRPGHLSASPWRRNEEEYGYNYQGGTGDVQIHQHIHEYRFNDGTEACAKAGRSCYSKKCCPGDTCVNEKGDAICA